MGRSYDAKNMILESPDQNTYQTIIDLCDRILDIKNRTFDPLCLKKESSHFKQV